MLHAVGGMGKQQLSALWQRLVIAAAAYLWTNDVRDTGKEDVGLRDDSV